MIVWVLHQPNHCCPINSLSLRFAHPIGLVMFKS